MKKIFPVLLILVAMISFNSCRDASTKADQSDTLKKNLPGDAGMEKEKVPANTGPATGTRSDSNIIKNGGSDILVNIDRHVVTKAIYPTPGSSGGISNGSISIENTLPNTSFQKVMIEVSILLADGKEYRTDYYTVINLDPGMKKTVRIPNTTLGNSVVSHVVKVKSNELTNGELILVGNHYTPQ